MNKDKAMSEMEKIFPSMMTTVPNLPSVKFKKLDSRAKLPKYETSGAAGVDLVALMPRDGEETVRVSKEEVVKIGTGLAVEIPEGYYAEVCSRSGNVAKLGLVVANQPGTIDSDYRGEIGVLLTHIGPTWTTVREGQRIAQLIFKKYEQLPIEEAKELSNTERGEGGFGSTGK